MDKSRKNLGFTMIEMIVSISIFMLITSVVLANFSSNSKSQQVRFNAQDMSSVIRKAQLMSQFGRFAPGTTIVPVGGFGIHIEQCHTPVCSYLMFADIDGELDYDVGEEIAGETHFLPPLMIIDAITTTPLDLVFKPPRPYVCINGKCDQLTDVDITIKHISSNVTQKVRISPLSGKVSVE